MKAQYKKFASLYSTEGNPIQTRSSLITLNMDLPKKHFKCSREKFKKVESYKFEAYEG